MEKPLKGLVVDMLPPVLYGTLVTVHKREKTRTGAGQLTRGQLPGLRTVLTAKCRLRGRCPPPRRDTSQRSPFQEAEVSE